MHFQYIAAIFASFALTDVLADPIAMPAAEVEAAAGAQVLEVRSEQGEQGEQASQASQGYYGRYPYRRRRNRNRYNRRRRYNRYDDDHPNYNQCVYGIDCDSNDCDGSYDYDLQYSTCTADYYYGCPCIEYDNDYWD